MNKKFTGWLSALLITCLFITALPMAFAEDAAVEPEIEIVEPETALEDDLEILVEEIAEAEPADEEAEPESEAETEIDGFIDEAVPEADDAGDTGLTIDTGDSETVVEPDPEFAAFMALYENEEYGSTELMGPVQARVGYVAVAAGTAVYKDAELTEALGRFAADSAAYAEAVEGSGDVLRLRFDTQDARDWAEAVPTGYLPAAEALSLTDADGQALADELKTDSHTRGANGIPVPCAAFEAEAYAVMAAENIAELGVTAHTQAQVQAFVDAHPAYRYQINIYSVADTDAPYASGRLSPVNQQSALNLVNQVRYIAGVNADLTLLADREPTVAAASLVLRLNGALSHYPARPAALSGSAYDALYNLGYSGAGSSNIAMGYTATSAILAYMADADTENIATVGHRRWILNPGMGKTIFGASGRFSAMYAHDMSGSGKQTKVAWPGQEMPLQYFAATDPWSVSYGRVLEASKVEVDLVRVSDGKAWHFSQAKSDGYFNVENSYYGRPGCVIFRPNGLDGLANGDRFNVSITDGATGEITRYSVHFFGLDLSGSEPFDAVTTAASRMVDGVHLSWNAISGATGYYVCRREGDGSYQIIADVTGGTACVDAAIRDGVTYTYQVYAHNASVTSRSAVGVQPTTLIAQSVKLNKSGTVKLYTNATLQLIAALQPENAVAKLTWKTSNKKIAKVDANGLVKPVKAGTATITVTTDSGKSAKVKVKVAKPPKPTKVKLNKSGTVKLSLYDTLTLTATLKPAAASTKLTWKSSNKKIAKVSGKGVVTPKKAGTATITVKTSNGKKAKVKVKVYDPYAPTKVTLSETGTVTMKVGEVLVLDAALTPDNARTKLTWSTSDKKIAKVSASGTVTAKKKGKATITVKTGNGKKAKVKIKVVK